MTPTVQATQNAASSVQPEILQDGPHGHRSLAYGARHPLDGIVPDVADGEHTWRAGLEREGRSTLGP